MSINNIPDKLVIFSKLYGKEVKAIEKNVFCNKRIKEINIDDDLEKILESKMLFDDIASGYYNFYANASLDRRFVKGYSRITGEVLSSMRRSRIFWRRLFRRKRPEDFLVAEDFLAEVAEEAAGGAF